MAFFLTRFKAALGVGHRKNRTGENLPDPTGAVAALTSTVRFELPPQGAFAVSRLGVALRCLVLAVGGPVPTTMSAHSNTQRAVPVSLWKFEV